MFVSVDPGKEKGMFVVVPKMDKNRLYKLPIQIHYLTISMQEEFDSSKTPLLLTMFHGVETFQMKNSYHCR